MTQPSVSPPLASQPPPPPPPPQSHGAGVQVRCAGCRMILTVVPGRLDFVCPTCQMHQMLPPELTSRSNNNNLPAKNMLPPPPQLPAHGIDPTKIQLPCAICKAILNVPHGLIRFVCPQCGADLAVDRSKLNQPSVHPIPPPPLPLPPPVQRTVPPPEEVNELMNLNGITSLPSSSTNYGGISSSKETDEDSSANQGSVFLFQPDINENKTSAKELKLHPEVDLELRLFTRPSQFEGNPVFSPPSTVHGDEASCCWGTPLVMVSLPKSPDESDNRVMRSYKPKYSCNSVAASHSSVASNSDVVAGDTTISIATS